MISEAQILISFVVGLFIFAIVYINAKFFQTLGIGFIPFILMVVVFCFLSINNKITLGKETYRAELTSFIRTTSHDVKISVKLDKRTYELNVNPEIIPVDSVDISVEKGVLGLKRITDSATIEIKDCPESNLSQNLSSDLELARNLIHMRCLEQAISHYDAHLQLNEDDHAALYERASTHLALKHYDKALRDFRIIESMITHLLEQNKD